MSGDGGVEVSFQVCQCSCVLVCANHVRGVDVAVVGTLKGTLSSSTNWLMERNHTSKEREGARE